MLHRFAVQLHINIQLLSGEILYDNGDRDNVSELVKKNIGLIAGVIEQKSDCVTDEGNGYVVIEFSESSASLHLENVGGLFLLEELYKQVIMPCNYLLPFLVETNEESLFDYQKEGVEWLSSNNLSILADDMGLGKSLQVIVSLSRLFNSGKIKSCIILSPKTLIKNWVDQFNQWAPHFSVLSIVAPSKDILSSLEYVTSRYHIIVTNYESVRGCPEVLDHNLLDVMVCDEAHRLRKSTSSINKTITLSDIKRRWLLTGTPIEKDSLDAINLSVVLAPNRVSISSDLAEFKALMLLKKYALRRTKKDLIDSIPKPNEKNIFIDLSSCQRKLYNKTLKEALKPVNVDNQLKYFNLLRGVVEYSEECDANSKIDYVANMLMSLPSSINKSIVFSYLLKPLKELKSILQKNTSLNVVMIDGSQTASERFDLVEKFQHTDSIDIVLASIRAASEGITLTKAYRVIFLNKWWNPSLNMQARDRVIRIGQDKSVDVISLYVNDTVDDLLIRTLQNKKELWKRLVEQGLSESLVASLIMSSVKG